MTIPTNEQIKQIAQAVDRIYQQIGSDLNLDNDNDSIAIVEICIDADRLSSFGFPELEEIFQDWYMTDGVELDDCYRRIANVAWGYW